METDRRIAKPVRIGLHFLIEALGLLKRIFDVADPVKKRMAGLMFAILIPISILVPTFTRAFNPLADRLAIVERQSYLLPVAMIIYGLLIRSLETEDYWKLFVLAILWSCVISFGISFVPPFSS